MNTEKLFRCELCEFDTDEVNLYTKHIKKTHNLTTNLKCGVIINDNKLCGRSVNTFAYLKTHMKKCSQLQRKTVFDQVCGTLKWR